MVKLLLALIFSILTILPPAGAVCCSENINSTLPECCVNHVSSVPTVSDLCCQMEGKDAVAPTVSLSITSNDRHSYIASIGQSKLTPEWLIEGKTSSAITARTPEHLATNKIYLLKRSLLI